MSNLLKSFPWLHYVGGIAMTGSVTALGYFFFDKIEFVNVALLYQLPVLLTAFWWGRWPSYFTAICSLLCFDYLFVTPFFTFSIADLRFVWSFVTFLIVAFIIGGRTEILRYEARSAHQREKSTRALFEFSRKIAAIIDLDTIIRELITQVSLTLDHKAVVFLPDDNNQLHIWEDPKLRHKAKFPKDANPKIESSAIAWVYKSQQKAGHGTNFFPDTNYLYLPLTAGNKVLGVLGIHFANLVTPEQRRLINAWAGLAAVAMERISLAEKERQASLILESDRLRTALLNSVSHELKTPLSFIIGSVSSLLDTETIYSEEAKHELLESIREGANRMERIIANLLDTARIESGMMHLKHDWCDIEDIIGTALRRLNDQLKNRPLIVDISVDIPLLKADCVLLEQVVVNLLDNALKYSPAKSPLEITVTYEDAIVQVSVADKGIGIPKEDLARIFDKFYRVKQRTVQASGTGLGLSICKSIIEAHKGRIWAENRPEGGTIISFSLPAPETEESKR